ncbi:MULTISPECIES: hypothetical protein [unclassified Methanoculleus]|jgi:hypothetical protein|uniref:HEAT repeat domain-containing protein n=1 Tax=Methanoculleus palmolei TaxID=72612 RepID=A0ABD8A9L5_9EURY|nr:MULTISPECIES: hypothetical protein [unclassified Methanoculleus]MDD2473697.1 hypothetical protein [Methanoculleus sp.]WOX56229.1 hypothetical protein R6Y95_02560 [Methanoculleus palmolei]
MTRKESYIREIARLLSSFLTGGNAEDLLTYLVAGSNLPGPRANLELAGAFSETVREFAGADADDNQVLWTLCVELSCISPEDAPTDDPHEFLPFCGVRGIGAIGSLSPECVEAALAHLAEAAVDPRRRVREAAAMAIRDLLSLQRETTVPGLEDWVEGGSWPAMRAVITGVAEPDLLAEPDFAEAAFRFHRKTLIRVYMAKERESEAFRALREALGYTLSPVIAALPGIGFEYLRQLATLDDADIRWIIQENLKEGRLGKRYPETVQHIRAQMA